MPLIELGSTMRRMVCQRVAPTFQHASRNDSGHGGERLLGAGDDHRQGHDRQRQRGGQDRVAEPGEQHEGAEAEQRVHDAGHAGQVDDRQVDEAGEPVVARVFVQVDRRQHADRAQRSAARRPPGRSCRAAPARCRPCACRRVGLVEQEVRGQRAARPRPPGSRRSASSGSTMASAIAAKHAVGDAARACALTLRTTGPVSCEHRRYATSCGCRARPGRRSG